jgi:hypothetical protein
MESLSCTKIIYLPVLSVTVPVPEVLITVTDGSGTDCDISYTRPLTLIWPERFPLIASKPVNIKSQTDRKSKY